MMSDVLTGTPHLTDGEILRFGDGECGQLEGGRIARHLAECSRCADAARFLEVTTKQLTASLDEIEVQPVADAKQRFLAAAAAIAPAAAPPETRRMGQLLRAAIVVFGLIGAGMWAPPVRAWFLELITPAGSRSVEVVPTPDREGTSAQRTSSTISFVPTASTLMVDIATRQDGGSLTIRLGEGSSVSARVTGRAPSDSVLVMGNGIRIRNSAASSATYSITIPASVSRISVFVGGGAASSYSAQTVAARDSLVISLAR